MSKGYYQTYKIADDVIHGGSFAIHISNIDFINNTIVNIVKNELVLKFIDRQE